LSVAVAGLRKSFDGVVALDGVDLVATDQELLVVVGPSGSGKSTLLRCIAGLIRPDAGTVEIGGADVEALPPGERDVAMVFQEHALFPHMDVTENIAFGLRARGESSDEVKRRVGHAAELLDIESLLNRRPSALSGGERQRVALARAMVRAPRAFLMDEPLSDLDAELRAYMRGELKQLQRDLATTTVYVTHDQLEAMTMADRVAVLKEGRIEQVAEPTVLYDAPATMFVGRFIGYPPMNLVPAHLVGRRDATTVGVRAEHVSLVGPGEGRVAGRVVGIEITGADAVIRVQFDDHLVAARISRSGIPAEGSGVGLAFDESRLRFFDADGRAMA
jgi:ABC-type sugar transport system ATPase subunit